MKFERKMSQREMLKAVKSLGNRRPEHFYANTISNEADYQIIQGQLVRVVLGTK